jgi:hypothetical protein
LCCFRLLAPNAEVLRPRAAPAKLAIERCKRYSSLSDCLACCFCCQILCMPTSLKIAAA